MSDQLVNFSLILLRFELAIVICLAELDVAVWTVLSLEADKLVDVQHFVIHAVVAVSSHPVKPGLPLVAQLRSEDLKGAVVEAQDGENLVTRIKAEGVIPVFILMGTPFFFGQWSEHRRHILGV